MKKITVRTKAAKKLRAGYPLLVAEDLNSPFLEDDFAQFFDEKGQALHGSVLSRHARRSCPDHFRLEPRHGFQNCVYSGVHHSRGRELV